jgi:PadR family transcriptional regulator, regulatory protein PadR
MYLCTPSILISIKMYSPELIKGNLKTVVLKLLSENGRMYGYEITQQVKELSKNKIQITEGALYPLLHALEAEGDVTTETEFIGKRIRKYYLLTKSGKNTMKERVKEFSDFISTMQFLLNLKPSGLK